MNKFLCCIISSLLLLTLNLSALDYTIQDIGTLQTHSSQAIALNNKSEILGWYKIEGAAGTKHYFLRERDGDFHEIPTRENGNGVNIEWRFLNDEGNVYGTSDNLLFMWDQKNGTVNLGKLPGKDIVAINNKGQVLIKSITENVNGKNITRPIIWDNGQITKLKGLAGDIGIESDESYGLDMNNNGDVVGKSVFYLSYKNNVYKQTHATKWFNGKAIDLHEAIPKTNSSYAVSINDNGDFIIYDENRTGNPYLVRNDGVIMLHHHFSKLNKKYIYHRDYFTDINKTEPLGTFNHMITKIVRDDKNSIWFNVNEFIVLNNSGEIIADAETIYGEKHAMLLTPKSQ